jgi:hypothetical protein
LNIPVLLFKGGAQNLINPQTGHQTFCVTPCIYDTHTITTTVPLLAAIHGTGSASGGCIPVAGKRSGMVS